ncbi:MAG: hypothetical protein CVT98_05800 [Bacteroidetes bacterium HGW-Bacteroidetes-15]|nr:MAG: hypothetical protein CVT98_05800 [Bacteroidetes bacterium HGW-Bacteroidetes-15]
MPFIELGVSYFANQVRAFHGFMVVLTHKKNVFFNINCWHSKVKPTHNQVMNGRLKNLRRV